MNCGRGFPAARTSARDRICVPLKGLREVDRVPGARLFRSAAERSLITRTDRGAKDAALRRNNARKTAAALDRTVAPKLDRRIRIPLDK
jgi:hypothetical protein